MTLVKDKYNIHTVTSLGFYYNLMDWKSTTNILIHKSAIRMKKTFLNSLFVILVISSFMTVKAQSTLLNNTNTILNKLVNSFEDDIVDGLLELEQHGQTITFNFCKVQTRNTYQPCKQGFPKSALEKLKTLLKQDIDQNKLKLQIISNKIVLQIY